MKFDFYVSYYLSVRKSYFIDIHPVNMKKNRL